MTKPKPMIDLALYTISVIAGSNLIASGIIRHDVVRGLVGVIFIAGIWMLRKSSVFGSLTVNKAPNYTELGHARGFLKGAMAFTEGDSIRIPKSEAEVIINALDNLE